MRKLLFITVLCLIASIAFAQNGGCFKPNKLKHIKAKNNGGSALFRQTKASSALNKGIGIGNSFISGVDIFYSYEKKKSETIYIEYEFGVSWIDDFNNHFLRDGIPGGYIMCTPRLYLSFANKELAGKSMIHYPGAFLGFKLADWYYPSQLNLFCIGPNIGYRYVFFERILFEASLGCVFSNYGDVSFRNHQSTSETRLYPEFNASLICLIF